MSDSPTDTRPRCATCGHGGETHMTTYGLPQRPCYEPDCACGLFQPATPTGDSDARPTAEEAQRQFFEDVWGDEYDGSEVWRFHVMALNKYTTAIRAESAAALQEARDGCSAALVSEQRLLAEVAGLREQVKGLREVNGALRAGLEWCLEEGGWRLTYYGSEPYPIAFEVAGSTSQGVVRSDEEILHRLAPAAPGDGALPPANEEK